MNNETIQVIVGAALAIPTLLAFGAMFILRRADKVDEYLEPLKVDVECTIGEPFVTQIYLRSIVVTNADDGVK